MSRCFPYPPPGCTLSRTSEEALIESIKLQKEKKTKEQRKEKRRDKKERKKEKKDEKQKKKEKKDETQNLDKSDIVQDHIGKKLLADAKDQSLHKGSKAEPEQLEQSSVTEEHGQPVCLRRPSTSSDSTENSNKRKRNSAPIDGTRGHGKIIRIRLSSKKQNESDVSANEQQLCSTSGRTHVSSQTTGDLDLSRIREDLCCASDGTSNTGQGFTLSSDRNQVCSTSQQINPVAVRKVGIPSVTDAAMTSMQRVELQYENLMSNLVPPPWHEASSLDTEDLDWLFQGKSRDIRNEKIQKSGNDDLPCSGSSALWPRAQYLQEVDVCALPFTVPF